MATKARKSSAQANKAPGAPKNQTQGRQLARRGAHNAEKAGSIPAPATSTKRADWERIETDYRAGAKSLREIASAHGITEGAIRKRAKKESWDRDLAERVRLKADALVRKELVRSEVRNEPNPTEARTVEVEAEVQARIRLTHRKDIGKARNLVMAMFDELEFQTGNAELLKGLGELMFQPDENGIDKLNQMYQKVISLGSRTTTVKALAESLRGLIGLEREAFGLDEAQASTVDPLIALLQGRKPRTLPIVANPTEDLP